MWKAKLSWIRGSPRFPGDGPVDAAEGFQELLRPSRGLQANQCRAVDTAHDGALRWIEVKSRDVVTFSQDIGSLETFKDFVRCGFRPA
ncbi:MAG: hypothetical protein C0524_02550 [Rhodobacter sp.]|nr:hypothetical protein [Rhodobacter sp.]